MALHTVIHSIATILGNHRETLAIAESFSGGRLHNLLAMRQTTFLFLKDGKNILTAPQLLAYLHLPTFTEVNANVIDTLSLAIAAKSNADWGVAIWGHLDVQTIPIFQVSFSFRQKILLSKSIEITDTAATVGECLCHVCEEYIDLLMLNY